ncbi:MAG: ABC transporter permease [Patescibacteria group bacterium]|nr:ABC transporter permease [bacterium]MDZ4241171.1 ABC transporter permease [Patescibacteria group bacterium]
MKFSDILGETYTALSGNKVRSGLTMLGIVIGISSVITMVAIGTGAQGTIQSSIQSLGSNLIQISPGAQRTIGFGASTGRGSAQTLTLEDAEAILSEVSSVNAISPEVSSRYQVTAKGTNTNTSVVGVTSSYPAVRNVAIAEGSFISDTHNASGSKVAVIGPTVSDDLFGEGASVIGQTIRINQLQFKIVGVTETKGGSGFTNQDDQIYIPLITAQRYLTGDKYVTSINVQAADADVMKQVAQDITDLLLMRHKISDSTQADFSILNQEDIISTASSITQTFTILLAAVAGISLLVGGIGIMNMMLTTVTERTREIGLRKAIGAKRRDISLQFLAEAIMLTFVGGFVGVVLGWGISFTITALGLIQTEVSIFSILLAFGVSAVIGIVFGYYPARRAAALNPIEALRYE